MQALDDQTNNLDHANDSRASNRVPWGIDGLLQRDRQEILRQPFLFADSAGPDRDDVGSPASPRGLRMLARFRSPRARSSAARRFAKRRRHPVRQRSGSGAWPKRERKHVQIGERESRS